MASSSSSSRLGLIFFFLFLFNVCYAARKLSDQSQYQLLQYHHGPLLSGPISLNLIWYGNFNPTQRSILSDFISSVSSTHSESQPSVSTWWNNIGKLYPPPASKTHSSPSITLGPQILDASYSLGKSLTSLQIKRLASQSKSPNPNGLTVVLTSADVAVEGFCSSTCGTHGAIKSKSSSSAYIWVGNSEKQCPGQCAWPFHQPIYGPQSPALVAPNADVGLDGMVINLAALLAGTVTNPFGNGYYQGPKEAPLEAASACPGVFGKGAYPGYAGDLLVESSSGASYNANGGNGRKYLLPALFNPSTSTCSTLV